MSEEAKTEETPAPTDKTYTLKVDRKEVQVSHEEVIRRAQLGSKRERWEGELQQKESEMKANAEAYAGYEQLRGWMANNPEGAARMRAIYAGEQPPASNGVQPVEQYNRESNPTLADPGPDPAQVQAMEAQLARLSQIEARMQANLATQDRNAQETATGAAIRAQSQLDGNADAQDYVRMVVDSELMRNPGVDVADVAAEAATKFEGMIGRQSQATLDGRLQQEQLGTLAPGSGGPAILPPDEIREVADGKGRDQLRSGSVKAAAMDFLQRQAGALINPPGKR